MKTQKGFTLIEIVIVIGIIGLLMVVLVPSITSSWNTNNMKAARLQAERVAKSIKVGILSGDIKALSTTDPLYTELSPSNEITMDKNYINYIGGIDTLYEIDAATKTNEDLIDPTSKAETDALRSFRIRYKYPANKIEIYDADTGKILLYSEPIE